MIHLPLIISVIQNRAVDSQRHNAWLHYLFLSQHNREERSPTEDGLQDAVGIRLSGKHIQSCFSNHVKCSHCHRACSVIHEHPKMRRTHLNGKDSSMDNEPFSNGASAFISYATQHGCEPSPLLFFAHCWCTLPFRAVFVSFCLA